MWSDAFCWPSQVGSVDMQYIPTDRHSLSFPRKEGIAAILTQVYLDHSGTGAGVSGNSALSP